VFVPTFQQAAKKFSGRLVLAKLNTEDFPEVTGKYGIRGIPTMIAFKNGIETGRKSGALALPELVSYLNQLL